MNGNAKRRKNKQTQTMLSVAYRGHFFWINLLSWVDNADEIWYSEQGLANANKTGWMTPVHLFDV
jgi:hypothetical protein